MGNVRSTRQVFHSISIWEVSGALNCLMFFHGLTAVFEFASAVLPPSGGRCYLTRQLCFKMDHVQKKKGLLHLIILCFIISCLNLHFKKLFSPLKSTYLWKQKSRHLSVILCLDRLCLASWSSVGQRFCYYSQTFEPSMPRHFLPEAAFSPFLRKLNCSCFLNISARDLDMKHIQQLYFGFVFKWLKKIGKIKRLGFYLELNVK